MAQTDAFMERMDKRRRGLWADQRELEVADGSALEDRCWTGDSDGPVGRDCSSNEASAEPGLVAEICDAVPKKSCDLEPVEVELTKRLVEVVMADAVVPCLGPLAFRPLSLGARDEELASIPLPMERRSSKTLYSRYFSSLFGGIERSCQIRSIVPKSQREMALNLITFDVIFRPY
ncbi:Hypothetical predicted protein [Octopus vulgaris]|uniref:Uncharacterized protein n=1 Tax=Octopus vulgaris TaxID=6645 RepID=A0AA36BVH0_OCTVU|nr:Hypothetical predicted protein [Octopus vulgaris]